MWWSGPGIPEAFCVVVVLVAMRHLRIFSPHHPPPRFHYFPTTVTPPLRLLRLPIPSLVNLHILATLVSHLLVSSVQLPRCLHVQRPAPPAPRHGVATLQG